MGSEISVFEISRVDYYIHCSSEVLSHKISLDVSCMLNHAINMDGQ